MSKARRGIGVGGCARVCCEIRHHHPFEETRDARRFSSRTSCALSPTCRTCCQLAASRSSPTPRPGFFFGLGEGRGLGKVLRLNGPKGAWAASASRWRTAPRAVRVFGRRLQGRRRPPSAASAEPAALSTSLGNGLGRRRRRTRSTCSSSTLRTLRSGPVAVGTRTARRSELRRHGPWRRRRPRHGAVATFVIGSSPIAPIAGAPPARRATTAAA